MKYNYVEPGISNQYIDDYDLTQNIPVKARYIKSKIDGDNGNPFIEALPQPRLGKEVSHDYTRSISKFSREKQAELNNYEKIAAISQLRKVRFVLPFHKELEEYFHMALLLSYRERKLEISLFSNYSITKNNQEVLSNTMVYGSSTAAANAGITLLGYSGCGKSAALEILLSNYPQVIEHTMEDGSVFTQIVYLPVVCAANSNFAALYQSIGAEIDRVLGNMEPVYEELIRKTRTLGEKVNVICRLINTFGIGCLIFDEIQLMDFASTKENSFESLLTIVNRTKVALMSVGTEEAYSKMFPNVRTARRTGNLIDAKGYCNDKKYFDVIVKNLFKYYQWFEKDVECTRDIIDAFYDVTKGIIDQLIGVYIFMQIDYIRKKNKPIVNADYVYKIADLYYPGMQRLLKDVDMPFNEEQRRQILEDAQLKLQAIEDEAYQQAEATRLLEEQSSESRANIENIKDCAVEKIQSTIKVTGELYNFATITRAVDYAIKKLGYDNLDESVVTRVAYEWLKKQKSDARTPKKRAAKGSKHTTILEELADNMK